MQSPFAAPFARPSQASQPRKPAAPRSLYPSAAAVKLDFDEPSTLMSGADALPGLQQSRSAEAKASNPHAFKVAFLGLDNSGKTTLLRRLKDKAMTATDPTLHAKTEDIVVGGVAMQVVDMPGHELARSLWDAYGHAIDGIVFLVDSAEPNRFLEAREELQKLLRNPHLAAHRGRDKKGPVPTIAAPVPIAILAQKMDMPGASKLEDTCGFLGLNGSHVLQGADAGYVHGEDRAMQMFPCSVLNEWGYDEALRWLLSAMQEIKTHSPDAEAVAAAVSAQRRERRRLRRRARKPIGWRHGASDSESPDSDA